jgi:hypothetical protein
MVGNIRVDPGGSDQIYRSPVWEQIETIVQEHRVVMTDKLADVECGLSIRIVPPDPGVPELL